MSEITRYEIDMLDVKAADAFLVHAFVKQESGSDWEYVVLVDAGNEGDGEKIINHINKYYGQKYIDLAIITHCDADHYGGMKYLVQQHEDEDNAFKINKVWVHDPYEHVDVDDVKYIRKEETLRDRLNAAYAFADGSNLLDLLDDANIPREEAFRGKTYDPVNIRVLGPTVEYYESLIPEFRVNVDFKEEVDNVYLALFSNSQTEDEFYSKTLEDAYDDPSSVNQSSVIFRFNAKGKKHIFTGDAGKEALAKVVDNDTAGLYKNVAWMKVPHHGSKHNLNNAIIAHFHPSISYISTEKYGKYANRCTVNALKKVGLVYSTHKTRQSIWYHDGTANRDDYTSVESL